jgi:signal transduction histidine kinase
VNLAHSLYPVQLEAGGLISAMEELAADTAAAGTACEFTCGQDLVFGNTDMATHLYRIAQEAVHNALRHARAKRIEIAISRAEGRTVMTVQDDGAGIPEALLRDPNRHGMGLRIMAYRARTIGAEFAISRPPSGGTRIACAFSEVAARQPSAGTAG